MTEADSAIELHILRSMLIDRLRLGLQPLAAYLACFPEHRDVVIAVYQDLLSGSEAREGEDAE